jgi:4-hydroxy-L-threonine phosphate dehydrogenase PdxA
MKKIKIGISIGDNNGIGMEVIIKMFRDNFMIEHPTRNGCDS